MPTETLKRLGDLPVNEAMNLFKRAIEEVLEAPNPHSRYLNIRQAAAYISDKLGRHYTGAAIRNWLNKGLLINYATGRNVMLLPEELEEAYRSLHNKMAIRELKDKIARKSNHVKIG